MSRLAHIDDLVDALAGVNLDAWALTSLGEDKTTRDRLLDQFLQAGDDWVEGETGTSWTPLAQWTDVLSGPGGGSIMLQRSPLVDVLGVKVATPPLAPSLSIPTASLRVDRKLGTLTILPGLQLAAGAPAGVVTYTFPRGQSNVLVVYRTGHAAVGSNVSVDAMMTDPWPTVARVTTDATYAYFEVPDGFGLYKSGETVASRSVGTMLRDSSDDSATWTMVSPRKLRCPIASYSAAAKYVLVYVPAAISSAVASKAAADVLRDKGAKDTGGTGGVTSRTTGPFKEDYGPMQYDGQIRKLEEDAQRLVRPFIRRPSAVI